MNSMDKQSNRNDGVAASDLEQDRIAWVERRKLLARCYCLACWQRHLESK